MKQITFLTLFIFIFISCEKNDTPKTAPALPPVETMAIDFSGWSDVNKSATIEKTNWIFSATQVGVWSFIIGTTFAVPVAAFRSAFAHYPTVIDDLTWQWEYTVDGFTSQYKARLTGKYMTSYIKWEMYVSKTGIEPFDEFMWFEGTSNIDGKSGQWILYHSAAFPEETVQIDWKKENDTVGEIKYTYVRELNDLRQTDKFKGSTLAYGLQNGNFDIYTKIHCYDFQLQSFTDTEIEWNRTTFNGHVKAQHFFNDTNWHCWDSQGNNTECN